MKIQLAYGNIVASDSSAELQGSYYKTMKFSRLTETSIPVLGLYCENQCKLLRHGLMVPQYEKRY